jgi:hypothetical protein
LAEAVYFPLLKDAQKSKNSHDYLFHNRFTPRIDSDLAAQEDVFGGQKKTKKASLAK